MYRNGAYFIYDIPIEIPLIFIGLLLTQNYNHN
jgi:hypothetical protein